MSHRLFFQTIVSLGGRPHLLDGDQIVGVGDELGVVPLFNAISSGRGHWRGLADTLLRMGRGWRSEIEPGCTAEVGSLYNSPLHPSQTTDLPGAPERDSATAESREQTAAMLP
eukprot:scaffold20950_cov151-Isochrysis_galbana.AAC.7